jgi:hypothetical protein
MPEELITLISTAGGDEVTHGTRRFRVDNDGTVRVPREAVDQLLKNGGFALPKQEVAIPHGHVRVRHISDENAQCSSGTPLSDGSCMVPHQDVAQLTAHGFYPVGPDGALIGAPVDDRAADAKADKRPSPSAELIQENADMKTQLAELQTLLKAAKGAK